MSESLGLFDDINEKKDAPLLVVAPGAKRERCRLCEAPIYWGRSKNGKPTPIDCDTERYNGVRRPIPRGVDVESLSRSVRTLYGDDIIRDFGISGWGVDHHITCPRASEAYKGMRGAP